MFSYVSAYVLFIVYLVQFQTFLLFKIWKTNQDENNHPNLEWKRYVFLLYYTFEYAN